MSAARDAIDSLLGGRTPARPVYVPLFAALAARIGNTTLRAMSSDAALWAAAAAGAAALYDLDALAIAADPVLLAEACAAPVAWDGDLPQLAGKAAQPAETPLCDGRLATLVEAARRAFATARAQRGCVAAITGPLTLAAQLFGPDEAAAELNTAKQLVTAALEALCEARPDLVVLVEDATLGGSAPTGAARRAYSTLRNVTAYFNVPLAATLEGYAPGEAAAFSALPCDVYVLGTAADGSAPAPWDGRALGAGARAIGVCLPPDVGGETLETIARWRRETGPIFFTSVERAAGDLDVDQVHAFVRALRQA